MSINQIIMNNISERVIQLMVHLGHNKSSFAKALDISLPVLTHITTGRNRPGLDMIQKILLHDETVSPDWLLLGKGEIHRSVPDKQDFTQISKALLGIESA